MPIYTYTCVTCDQESEKMIPVSDRDIQMCATCGYKLIRNMDRPGLVWSPTRNGGYS